MSMITWHIWPNSVYLPVPPPEECAELADKIEVILPEYPPECHQTRPVNADDAMAAVRAMCGGGK
jgi:hypothetical protein